MTKTPVIVMVLGLLLGGLSACGKREPQAPAGSSECARDQTCKVKLTWDYTDAARATITGFKLYYGTTSRNASGFSNYDHVVTIGPYETQATVPNLGGFVPIYFTMTAYADLESDYSNEVAVDLSSARTSTITIGF